MQGYLTNQSLENLMNIQGSHQSNVHLTNNMMTPPNRHITIGSGDTTINNSNTSNTEVKSRSVLDMLLGRNKFEEEEELMNLQSYCLGNSACDLMNLSSEDDLMNLSGLSESTKFKNAIQTFEQEFAKEYVS